MIPWADAMGTAPTTCDDASQISCWLGPIPRKVDQLQSMAHQQRWLYPKFWCMMLLVAAPTVAYSGMGQAHGRRLGPVALLLVPSCALAAFGIDPGTGGAGLAGLVMNRAARELLPTGRTRGGGGVDHHVSQSPLHLKQTQHR